MDTSLIRWPSPAKLNLFLHITGRRPDGYHQLQTLFQLLDSGDTLTFEPTTTPDIRLSDPIAGVNDRDNLIVRAALLLQQHCQLDRGCVIGLSKQLPMGGGLGGGSSNAATTLVALNHLWQCGLSTTSLANLGLQLGADVPVFIHGVSGFADGVGENITPTVLPERYYLVLHPGVSVSTAAVFSDPDLPRNTPSMQWRDFSFEKTHNDCQEIVTKGYREVEKCLSWLLEYAPSRMTGTGACLFAIFDTELQAQGVLDRVPDTWSGFVAKGVNRSPLRDVVAKLSE